jgi:hypothetical protein
MNIGRRLLQANLADEAAIEQAVERQRHHGGTLGDNLVALGLVSAEALQSLLSPAPPAPRRLDDLGLDPTFLVALTLKLLHGRGLDRPSALARDIRLPNALVRLLLEDARERGFVEVKLAQGASMASEQIYVLTQRGRGWLAEVTRDCGYVGPAPVPLASYVEQAAHQKITDDRVDEAALRHALEHLELPEALIGQLGPAVNSGRAVLLSGAPGNGKSTIAEALARCFGQTIWIPHAVMVAGTVIKLFDPAVHEEIRQPQSRATTLRSAIDERWARCPRPVVVTGGELALEMLDLTTGPGGVHHAPLQMKAQGGVVVIDDFGRQRVAARALLDRWIVPLERGYDVLTLANGHKFRTPFDGMVMLSTNISPEVLLDAAQLRRIPYKFHVPAPTPEAFRRIFERACRDHGLAWDDDAYAALMDEFYQRQGVPLAGYHPGFIVGHVVARCRYAGQPSRLTVPLVLEAASQLVMGTAYSAAAGSG